MNDEQPDFFLASTESRTLQAPRRCWRRGRLKSDVRSDDMLVIKVDPVIPGKTLGYGTDMDLVIVASKLEGNSLFPINTFPAHSLPVYVCRSLIGDVEKRAKIEDGEYELFAWAELYPSEAEARARLTYPEAQALGRMI